MKLNVFFITVLALSIIGCTTSPSSRYKHAQDFEPDERSIAHLKEPIPRYERPTKQGNPTQYTVWGKRYYVMKSAQGFSQTGLASWYGMKFHGHKTSNGEIYNVYKFSAAHKNLPLPTYVRVTRLDNNKSVIVRVNDRGPFHANRIIDLSYAAAVRLGMHKQGTARVKIETVTSAQPKPSITPKPTAPSTHIPTASKTSNLNSYNPNHRWVQVGAYRNLHSAFSLKKNWQTRIRPHTFPVQVYESKSHLGLYRIHIGPIQNGVQLNKFLTYLRQKHSVLYPVVLKRSEITR